MREPRAYLQRNAGLGSGGRLGLFGHGPVHLKAALRRIGGEHGQRENQDEKHEHGIHVVHALPADDLEQLREHQREDGPADAGEQVGDAQVAAGHCGPEPRIDQQRAGIQEELAAEQAHQHAQRGKLPGPVGRGKREAHQAQGNDDDVEGQEQLRVLRQKDAAEERADQSGDAVHADPHDVRHHVDAGQHGNERKIRRRRVQHRAQADHLHDAAADEHEHGPLLALLLNIRHFYPPRYGIIPLNQPFREQPCLFAPPFAHCFRILGRIELPADCGVIRFGAPRAPQAVALRRTSVSVGRAAWVPARRDRAGKPEAARLPVAPDRARRPCQPGYSTCGTMRAQRVLPSILAASSPTSP